jgi:hypothetical protein
MAFIEEVVLPDPLQIPLTSLRVLRHQGGQGREIQDLMVVRALPDGLICELLQVRLPPRKGLVQTVRPGRLVLWGIVVREQLVHDTLVTCTDFGQKNQIPCAMGLSAPEPLPLPAYERPALTATGTSSESWLLMLQRTTIARVYLPPHLLFTVEKHSKKP